jgi:hypothetical protein
MAKHCLQCLKLSLHQPPCVGRQQSRHALCAGVCAMRGGESVVDIDISEHGQLLCHPGIVLLFPWVKTRVLQNQHFTVRECLDCLCGHGPDTSLGKANLQSQHSLKCARHRPQ